MPGSQLLCVLFVALIVWGALENYRHRQNLKRIRIRIHVNGTQGKSSVTRLIAAALREAGLVTCAKTTGTLARMILPDGREVPIFRPAGPNVIEQGRMNLGVARQGHHAIPIEHHQRPGVSQLGVTAKRVCEERIVEGIQRAVRKVVEHGASV